MSTPRMVVACLALAGLGTMALLGGCQTRKAAPPATQAVATTDSLQAVKIQRGQQAFLANCAMCHGPWGEGDGPLAADLKRSANISPANLNDPIRFTAMGRPELVRIITLGGGQTHRSNLMPPWGSRLPAQTIEDIADFVLELPALKPGVPRATLEHYLEAPAGTPDAGRKLFVYYCTACHGPYGKGDGVMADTIYARGNVRPRNLTDSTYFAPKTDKELFTTVSLGGKYTAHSVFMPGWSAQLTPEEIKNLIAYVRSISRTTSRP